MDPVALEINDVGLRAIGEAGELYESPGFAYADGEIRTGAVAREEARLQPGRVFNHFWDDLSLEALSGNVRGAESAADLAYHHLREIAAHIGTPERVILAVPSHYSREQLSLLLGITREAGLPVSGMIDLAVASAATPAPGRQLLHLELLLHRAVLTRLRQGRRLRREQVTTAAGAGQLALYDAWAGAISDAFVRNTRFDPMHSAQAEQGVYERLPAWVAEAFHAGKTTMSVAGAGREHTTTVAAATLAQAARGPLRDIVRRVAAASRPGEPLTVLLSDRCVSVPGLHEALREAVAGVEIVDLPPGAAGSGALRRADEIVTGDDAVAFVTSVRWDAAAAAIATPPAAPPPAAGGAPTHVVYAGRAWPIGAAELYAGAEAGEGGAAIVVSGDTRGVSGRHCSVKRNGSAVVLTDHSRHGTFVNGKRIDGSATVFYGDVVRLGSGAQLLQLIAEQRGDGA